MRLGAIGIDTSHLSAFAARLSELRSEGATACEVTHVWDPPPENDGEAMERRRRADLIAGWRRDATAIGIHEVGNLEALLNAVDGVMVLTLDVRRHCPLAEGAAARGKPVFVDKVLGRSTTRAAEALDRVRASGGRCFAASALRFADEIARVPRDALGRIVSIDVSGPGEEVESMPGLWYYGCHPVELATAILGRGAARVRADAGPERWVVEVEHRDGARVRISMERGGMAGFGATVRGERGVHSFVVDSGPLYRRLVGAITRFFEGGPAPVDRAVMLETVAVLEAGEASLGEQGAWMRLEPS